MSIYTKKGDDGKTSVLKKVKGRVLRISKGSPLIDAVGSLDEANSYLGIVVLDLKTDREKIYDIQRNLFSIGSKLAGAKVSLKNLDTKKLEEDIDAMEKKLPELKNFILPGGSSVSAEIMYARTLVRKAERAIVRLKNADKEKSLNKILRYMNRLSDFLFVFGRWLNFKYKVKEIKWTG